MSLELRNVDIKDVVFGKENKIADQILHINIEDPSSVIMEDKRIKSVSFDLARPGESIRILPV